MTMCGGPSPHPRVQIFDNFNNYYSAENMKFIYVDPVYFIFITNRTLYTRTFEESMVKNITDMNEQNKAWHAE